MQYVSSATFLLAVYSNYLSATKANLNCPDGQTQPQELLNFVKSQVSFVNCNLPCIKIFSLMLSNKNSAESPNSA